MPTRDDVQYEFTSVKAIRGMEGRTIAKWQEDGWELDAQHQGTLRTELTFRRVKPKVPWRLLATVGAAIVLVILMGVIFGSQSGGAGSTTTAAPTETSDVPSEPTQGQAQEPEATEPEATEPESATAPIGAEQVLTEQNNQDLAALLAVRDPGAELVGQFAAKYAGATIEFDGNIADMMNSGGYTTRYDLLIGAGDYSETTAIGPAFKFENVNISYDLHLEGPNIPDTIGIGDNLHVVARVVEYNSTQQLFFLEPVSTQVR